MRRALCFAFAFGIAATIAGVGCATYQQDLERARHHYEATQFEESLALLRVLEPDLDSFNAAEQAQYAYLRGMTDFRLSSITPAGSSVSDPKKAYRLNARHWLSVAAAIEKQTPGGLTDEEKGRLGEAMRDLNHDWPTGEDDLLAAAADAGAPPAKPADEKKSP